MAKSSCKCKASECEECPEWIFTFADLVMLMMGFFVILWVLKPNSTATPGAAMDEKWLEVVAKIREAFDYLPDPTSKDPVDMHILMKKLEEMDPLKGAGDGGKTKVKPRGAEGTDPEVTSIRPGKHAIVGTRVFFEAGKADLSPEAERVLTQIAQTIRGHRQVFLVKGHASVDDFPEVVAPEKPMALSMRRAQTAADYLMGHGVEPEILRVQGCSTFEPVVKRAYSDDVRVLNRRVEVEASDNSVSERQDQAKTTNVPSPAPGLDSAASSVDTIDHR